VPTYLKMRISLNGMITFSVCAMRKPGLFGESEENQKKKNVKITKKEKYFKKPPL
jgi:hypothetical protein